MKNNRKSFNEIINNIKEIATKTIQDVKQHPEFYKITFDEQKALETINGVEFSKGVVRFADGITDVINNKIIINEEASKKWGDNYHKLVMLHELAHSFTYNVSNVEQAHCRSWLYWQYAFYKEAFGEYKAKELSKYNIARYAGLFNDSGIEPIEKFAQRIGVEFNDIDFNLPNVKNHCSNLLKHSEEFVKVRYFLREIDKTNSSLSCFEIQDEINQSCNEVIKNLVETLKNADTNSLENNELLKELLNDKETSMLLKNNFGNQISNIFGNSTENKNIENTKVLVDRDLLSRVSSHLYDLMGEYQQNIEAGVDGYKELLDEVKEADEMLERYLEKSSNKNISQSKPTPENEGMEM